MGANFKFDKRLPAIKPEAGDLPNPWRQVEVFTHGDGLHLRVGPVNQENVGIDRYTVVLSKNAAESLIDALQAGMGYPER